MLVVLAGFVAADADITFIVDKDNARAWAYPCLDSNCESVGGLIDSDITYNGRIYLSFPAQMPTIYGYAIYFVSEGYLPIEGAYNINCDPGDSYCAGSAVVGTPFIKAPICRSVIDSFSVTNYAAPHLPLVVDMTAAMDADAHSAFSAGFDEVLYIPEFLKDKYYSADTRVVLTVENIDSGEVVDTQTTLLTETNGNPIYVDSSEEVYYEWTPTEAGNYKATVTTTVIDDQCAAQEDMSAWDIFSVLDDLPRDLCYTLINNLETSIIEPTEGDNAIFSFDKISNYANNYPYYNPNYQITPKQTDVTYSYRNTRTGETGQKTALLQANPDVLEPTGHSFSFDLPSWGLYEITVYGTARNCQGSQNLDDTQTMNLYVYEELSVTCDANPLTGIEPLDVSFIAAASGGQEPYTYSWNFGDGGSSNMRNPSHTYTTYGTRTATVTAEDSRGRTASCSKQINVQRDYDISSVAADVTPLTGIEGQTQFRYTCTATGGNAPLTYGWTFGDGTTSSEQNPTHVFASEGSYAARCTVTDSDQDTRHDDAPRVTVEAPNIAPTASITFPGDGDVFKENDDITFSGSSTDEDGTVVSYEWTSSIDGTIETGTCNSRECVMSFSRDDISIGTHTITFEVVDDDGASSSDSIEITVAALSAPIVSITEPGNGDDFKEGELIGFEGEASDPDGDIVSYSWTSDRDGQVANTRTFSIDDLSIGVHEITFTATDDDGLSGSDSITIEIKPLLAPTAVITNPNDGDEFKFGEEILFEGYGEDPDGVIVSYEWTSDIDGFLDSGSCNLQRCEFSFARDDLSLGRHDITLTVYDDDELVYSDSDTVWIIVNPLLSPEVEIFSPAQGEEFLSTEDIDFSGIAADPDGMIEGYEWTSDIQGTLDSGDGEPVDLSMQLAAGDHLITLIAVDDDGQSGQDNVNIRVIARNCVDNDQDGHFAIDPVLCPEGDDCDDNDANNYPGNTESCDYQDNDCDSQIDEDFTNLGDSCTEGLGICESTGIFVCSIDGLTTECDAVPGQPEPDDESCDGLDNDCDGSTDEDYIEAQTECGTGGCLENGFMQCIDGEEIDSCIPGTPEDELCNGIDDDCDGSLDDDGEAEPWFMEITNCGTGACESTGNLVCLDGSQQDTCQAGTPEDELCNGIDDDCDGVIPADESDDDMDGWRICEGDCDDNDDDRFPGNPERDDNLDQNCIDDAAYWLPLEDKNVFEDSPDGTDVYDDLEGECVDVDDVEAITVYPTVSYYDLAMENENLAINNLVQDYNDEGEPVSVSCNGVDSEFILTVLPVDDDARWNDLEDKQILEDSPDGTVAYLDLGGECTDIDSDKVLGVESTHEHYSLEFNGDHLVISDLEENYNDLAGETVTVSCNSAEADFALRIVPENDAPVIVSDPVTRLIRDDPYSVQVKYEYDVDAIDPDDDNLTYSLLEAPDGMIIDAGTGLIEWKPKSSQTGQFDVIVKASDGSLFDVQAFTILVSLPEKETYAREKIGWTQLNLINDRVEAGEELLVLVSFTNKGLYDMDHSKITLIFPELALRSRIGPFDLDAGESATHLVPLYIPRDVRPGVYTLRATVSNDGVTRIKHRDVRVY